MTSGIFGLVVWCLLWIIYTKKKLIYILEYDSRGFVWRMAYESEDFLFDDFYWCFVVIIRWSVLKRVWLHINPSQFFFIRNWFIHCAWDTDFLIQFNFVSTVIRTNYFRSWPLQTNNFVVVALFRWRIDRGNDSDEAIK